MAIGSEDTVVTGKYGRTPPAPYGQIYVRDQAAAIAAAVKEKVELFESQGLEVPDFLKAQAAAAAGGGEPIVAVKADEVTQDSWRLIGEPEQAAAEPEPVAVPLDEPGEVDTEFFVEKSEVVEEVGVVEEEAPKPRRRTKKAESTEG